MSLVFLFTWGFDQYVILLGAIFNRSFSVLYVQLLMLKSYHKLEQNAKILNNNSGSLHWTDSIDLILEFFFTSCTKYMKFVQVGCISLKWCSSFKFSVFFKMKIKICALWLLFIFRWWYFLITFPLVTNNLQLQQVPMGVVKKLKYCIVLNNIVNVQFLEAWLSS